MTEPFRKSPKPIFPEIIHKYEICLDETAVNTALTLAPLFQDWIQHQKIMQFLEDELNLMKEEFNQHDKSREAEVAKHINDVQLIGMCIKAAISAGELEMVGMLLASFDNIVNKTRCHYEETTTFILKRRAAALETMRTAFGKSS